MGTPISDFLLIFLNYAVISTSLGGLSLLIITWWLYKVIKKRNEIKVKEKFFKRNGGLLLQQQLSSSENNVQKTKLFNSKELKNAKIGRAHV